MVSVKQKYGFLPTSVWHLNKDTTLSNLFKDDSEVRTKRRTENSFLPNYKLSEFNPKVTERVIKYWSNTDDLIFDPFAGRATRGLVANRLNRNYLGCEVSKKTFEWVYDTIDNLKGSKLFFVNKKDDFTLLNKDGCGYIEELENKEVDLVFTCPPYWKLEKYESCMGQLSDCKTYGEFMHKIECSIIECNRVLKQNKFSIWVVSDWRNKDFFCFHLDIINAHIDNGFILWDIVINVLNSPFVAFKAGFNDEQKYTGKTHEYILVFKKVKG